jgi:hypothetical protein
MLYIHTREYYSSINRNEVLIPTNAWMNLEDIMVTERGQSQMVKYGNIPFMYSVKYPDWANIDR